MSMLKEFREFAVKGNVIDLAVGVIIGAAFGKIVSSMVNDILMPPIGMAMNGVDFAQLKIELREKVGGVTDATGVIVAKEIPEVAIRYGGFVNEVINFLIVAFCIFLVIKAVNTARKRFEKQAEAAPPLPPAPDVVLLTEIRDLLRAGR